MKSSKQQPSKQAPIPNKTGKTKVQKPAKHHIVNFILIGIAIGLLLFALFRFIAYQPPKHTHYHANWDVYIDGEQQKFEDPSFYEEVANCNVNDEADIKHRAHMHDDVYDVVHVHADGVTWGQFLENINSTAQPNYLRIHSESFANEDGKKVTYILNGKQLDSLNGVIIGDQDKLLINYGDESPEVIQQRYDAIQNDAKHYDDTKDPAACGGDEGSTIWDRFKAILF